MTFATVDPSNGKTIATYEHASFEDARALLNASWDDFEKWRTRPIAARAEALKRWAGALRDSKTELATLMTREMGKPVAQSESEIEKSASSLEYLAEHGPSWLATKSVDLATGAGEISYEPVGPVLAIMPWNFPLWQLVRFAGPAICAGNTVLLKHSDQTAGSAELIVKIAARMTDGVTLIRNARIDHETCAKLMAEPRVRGVTFTGSTRGGSEIATTAAKYLKKTVLELGGSDAYLVLADADAAEAAAICAAARMINNGESCIAGKRFIVERAVAGAFIPMFAEALRAYAPGDPLKKDTKLGPLAAKKFQKQLAEQVAGLVRRGARVVLGGETPAGEGAYYPPTLLLFDKAVEGLGDEELFGPVAIVTVVESEDEAIRAANDGVYGLGAAILSRDESRARKLASRIEAGFVAINDQVKSDVRLPFGGVKKSGWGRELSFHGIHEFCNIQSRSWGTRA